ncbi:MAG TPA: MBL fold metallo-hydrolase [Micromonospora sp.]
MEAAVAAEPARPAVRSVGGFDVIALTDASGSFFTTRQVAFPTATASDWARAALVDPAAFGPEDRWTLDFRCYAIRRPGGRVALVDTGVGPAGSPASSWAPVPGHLPERLASAGIDPDDVDLVVLTHVHEDHVGWSVSPSGTPSFRHARYVIQRAEVAAREEVGDSMLGWLIEPLRRTGHLCEVDGATRLLGGAGRGSGATVRVLPTPGHTPGHQSVLVEHGHRQIVVTGDVLVHAVQLVAPEVGYRFERNPEQARRSRQDLLGAAVARHALLATAHLRRPFVPASAVPGPGN